MKNNKNSICSTNEWQLFNMSCFSLTFCLLCVCMGVCVYMYEFHDISPTLIRTANVTLTLTHTYTLQYWKIVKADMLSHVCLYVSVYVCRCNCNSVSV